MLDFLWRKQFVYNSTLDDISAHVCFGKTVNIFPLQATVENLERFCKEFGSGRTESKDEDNDLEIPKLRTSGKPPDFQALFGRGDDNNDHFMIGVKYTNR